MNKLPDSTEVEEVVNLRGGVSTEGPVACLALAGSATLSLEHPGEAHVVGFHLECLVSVGSHHGAEVRQSGIFEALLEDWVGL